MAVSVGRRIVEQWVRGQLTKKADDGIMITLPDQKKVDLNVNITLDRLMRAGVDPEALTNTKQVDNFINQINSMIKTQVISQDDPRFKGIMEGLMGRKDNVVDMTGKKIKDTSKIMGGKELTDSPLDDLKSIVDDFKPMQTEKAIKTRIESGNKKGLAKIKQRQKMLDDAIDDASPGFADDIKYDSEIVAENLAERMGLVYDDLPTKQRLDLYDQAYKGLSKKRFTSRQSLEDFVDDAGGVDENDPRGIDDFIPEPEDKAEGGRIGYKDGPNLGRRKFLQILGGLAAVPIVGKYFKFAKVGKTIKKFPVVETAPVEGKPVWFDALVNRVINEGDDVTKKLSTVEREVVHTKKINDTDQVTVYQDLNTDSIRVEYNSADNMLEEPVDLVYKRIPPDEGAPKGSTEFEVTESGFSQKPDGPDDFFIDAEPVGGSSIKDLDSDVSKLKEFATNKKPTLKEFVQSKKRKDYVKKLNEGDIDAQSDYIIRRQGDYDPDPNDFASGGIARMLGE
jgi:hypothetical protein